MAINSSVSSQKELLNPDLIPKYINQLPILPVFYPKVMYVCNKKYYQYNVDACEFMQQVLPPPFNPTLVWGFGGMCKATQFSSPQYMKSFPGPTFETIQNVPVHVTWKNNIVGSYNVPVDPTIMWANPLNLMNMMMPSDYQPFPPGCYQ